MHHESFKSKHFKRIRERQFVSCFYFIFFFLFFFYLVFTRNCKVVFKQTAFVMQTCYSQDLQFTSILHSTWEEQKKNMVNSNNIQMKWHKIENITHNSENIQQGMEYVFLLMHGHTRSILIEIFFNIFIFSAVGTCVAAHWNENYIKIMCKYNNQVNMKHLFCQARCRVLASSSPPLTPLHFLYSFYHCLSPKHLVAFLFRFSSGWNVFRWGVVFFPQCSDDATLCNCSSSIRGFIIFYIVIIMA